MADTDPDKVETAQKAAAGEMTRAPAGAATRAASTRPNYDSRQDAISTTRKPAGPPLAQPTATRSRAEATDTDDEPPVDPSD